MRICGWADVLDQADRVLLARVDEAAAAGEDSPLQNMLALMDVAQRAAARGDLRVAATSATGALSVTCSAIGRRAAHMILPGAVRPSAAL
ncbi:hypothetical protein ABZ891_24645 [Streptomyces sp. NPDC047023]|uniref:hypothetical protein n=1 Tax=Streptomyces sp. NPDC047023 TaxID=3155139 RepID=UPI0033D2DF3B